MPPNEIEKGGAAGSQVDKLSSSRAERERHVTVCWLLCILVSPYNSSRENNNTAVSKRKDN